MIQISEIYHSIQGESSFIGMPCVFVRTTGCNLRCVWCDTEYAFYGGEKMSIVQIIDRVKTFDCQLVEITGGEPLLQKEVPDLATSLLDLGYTVLIETSGERDISVLDERVIRIMDLKCPGSGESDKNRWENLEYLTEKDQIKFVLNDRRDYDWTVETIKKHRLNEGVQVLMSPVFGKITPDKLTTWILQDKLNVRMQLQLHKLIWPPDTKSV
jgi:7-carboxy-7-deazaguanine synthase